MAYRVVYSDGHAGEESFSFTNADQNAPEEGTPQDCGEASADDTEDTDDPEDTADTTNDTQVTSNVDEPTGDNSSESLPVWVWIAGGVGIVLVASIVIALLRGSRTDTESDDPADD